MATHVVDGDQYREIDGVMLEIKRQLRQNGGYPYDPQMLLRVLRGAVEGRFGQFEDVTAKLAEKHAEAMLRHGYHKAAGMKGVDYRQLWMASSVLDRLRELRGRYAGRFDEILLVDTTHSARTRLVMNSVGACDFYVQPENCEDIVPAPTHPETGEPLTRYIACVQTGGTYLGKSVRDACELIAVHDDEVGLTLTEGACLPGQHEAALRKHGIDLPGSCYGSDFAPYVYWFDCVQPGLSAHVVRSAAPGYGSASRGTLVVPVSW